MAYDPSLPKEGSECDAAEMRGQFAGLHDEIADKASLTQLNESSTALTQDIQAVEANSSANSNSVATISMTSGNFETQMLIEKYNELVLALRR